MKEKKHQLAYDILDYIVDNWQNMKPTDLKTYVDIIERLGGEEDYKEKVVNFVRDIIYGQGDKESTVVAQNEEGT